jgi:hypothetical protein
MPQEHHGGGEESVGEDEDGREEGAATPLEVLRTLLPVVGNRVASAMCLLFAWLSK